MNLPMYLELASYLTNQWSLVGEVKEDMGVSDLQIKSMIQNAEKNGLHIERHLRKIRLDIGTSIDQVRLAIEMYSNTNHR